MDNIDPGKVDLWCIEKGARQRKSEPVSSALHGSHSVHALSFCLGFLHSGLWSWCSSQQQDSKLKQMERTHSDQPAHILPSSLSGLYIYIESVTLAVVYATLCHFDAEEVPGV